MNKEKKKIGELLVEAGLITQDQLNNALLLQKSKHKRFGKVLIELGYVDEKQVAEALSKQLSIPLIECCDCDYPKEAISLVPKEIAESNVVMPVEVNKGKLILAMADPLDWQTIDKIAFRTGLNISVAVAAESSILDAIERNYGDPEKIWDLISEIPQYKNIEFIKGTVKDDEEVNAQSLYRLSEAPPIVKLVTMMLAEAVNSRASDVHIEPVENHVQVRYRIDGDLRNVLKIPKHIQDSVISRIKIISNLDITNRRLPQDGRSTLRLHGKNVDLRISTLPSVYGEKIVIRLLDRSTGLVPLSKLGIPDNILKPLIDVIGRPQGMLLITGPTGSGKTTTLYAILQQLQTESENIITIEDPVEYKLPGITQVGTNEAIGLSFASALRSTLRQDPDIIMVGEIRDMETAAIAARAALTGHFVLSTVHANSTVATITRLIDIGVEPYLVASSVTAILAQRLVRRICDKCKAAVEQPLDMAREKLPRLETVYKGSGCRECSNTGYRGRVGVYELLLFDTRLRRLINKGAAEEDLWEAAIESGATRLIDNAWAKVEEGITTVDEVQSMIPATGFGTDS